MFNGVDAACGNSRERFVCVLALSFASFRRFVDEKLSFGTAPVRWGYWTNGGRRIEETRTHRPLDRPRMGCAPGDARVRDSSFLVGTVNGTDYVEVRRVFRHANNGLFFNILVTMSANRCRGRRKSSKRGGRRRKSRKPSPRKRSRKAGACSYRSSLVTGGTVMDLHAPKLEIMRERVTLSFVKPPVLHTNKHSSHDLFVFEEGAEFQAFVFRKKGTEHGDGIMFRGEIDQNAYDMVDARFVKRGPLGPNMYFDGTVGDSFTVTGGDKAEEFKKLANALGRVDMSDPNKIYRDELSSILEQGFGIANLSLTTTSDDLAQLIWSMRNNDTVSSKEIGDHLRLLSAVQTDPVPGSDRAVLANEVDLDMRVGGYVTIGPYILQRSRRTYSLIKRSSPQSPPRSPKPSARSPAGTPRDVPTGGNSS